MFFSKLNLHLRGGFKDFWFSMNGTYFDKCHHIFRLCWFKHQIGIKTDWTLIQSKSWVVILGNSQHFAKRDPPSFRSFCRDMISMHQYMQFQLYWCYFWMFVVRSSNQAKNSERMVMFWLQGRSWFATKLWECYILCSHKIQKIYIPRTQMTIVVIGVLALFLEG